MFSSEFVFICTVGSDSELQHKAKVTPPQNASSQMYTARVIKHCSFLCSLNAEMPKAPMSTSRAELRVNNNNLCFFAYKVKGPSKFCSSA